MIDGRAEPLAAVLGGVRKDGAVVSGRRAQALADEKCAVRPSRLLRRKWRLCGGGRLVGLAVSMQSD